MGPKLKSSDPLGMLALSPSHSKVVFVVTTENAILPVYRDFSVNTYAFPLFHEGVSEVSERAREQSE